MPTTQSGDRRSAPTVATGRRVSDGGSASPAEVLQQEARVSAREDASQVRSRGRAPGHGLFGAPCSARWMLLDPLDHRVSCISVARITVEPLDILWSTTSRSCASRSAGSSSPTGIA